jgi:hypothetical protein
MRPYQTEKALAFTPLGMVASVKKVGSRSTSSMIGARLPRSCVGNYHVFVAMLFGAGRSFKYRFRVEGASAPADQDNRLLQELTALQRLRGIKSTIVRVALAKARTLRAENLGRQLAETMYATVRVQACAASAAMRTLIMHLLWLWLAYSVGAWRLRWAAMAAPCDKYENINKLRATLPFISQSALAAWSKAVHEQRVPDIGSKQERITIAMLASASQLLLIQP